MEEESLNAKELSVKCQSKKDMYRILQIEGGVYLPPISQSDHKFIAQIVTREKKASFLSNIIFLVPPKQEYQSDTSATHSRIENQRNT